ncbi:MAG: hypothetical protein AAF203_11180, partial [Pseudomonadota bacterium]
MKLAFIIPFIFFTTSLSIAATKPANYVGVGLEVEYEETFKIPGFEKTVRPPLIISDYNHALIFGIGQLTDDLKEKLDANNFTAVAVNPKTGDVTRVETLGASSPIGIGIYFFDYLAIPTEVGVGPYNETILTAAVVDQDKLSPIIKDVKYFIWDIKVSDQTAILAGRRLWNFPKTYGQTVVTQKDSDWIFQLKTYPNDPYT